jgi:hypothetical protein
MRRESAPDEGSFAIARIAVGNTKQMSIATPKEDSGEIDSLWNPNQLASA